MIILIFFPLLSKILNFKLINKINTYKFKVFIILIRTKALVKKRPVTSCLSQVYIMTYTQVVL